jgi:hypothetical protein
MITLAEQQVRRKSQMPSPESLAQLASQAEGEDTHQEAIHKLSFQEFLNFVRKDGESQVAEEYRKKSSQTSNFL